MLICIEKEERETEKKKKQTLQLWCRCSKYMNKSKWSVRLSCFYQRTNNKKQDKETKQPKTKKNSKPRCFVIYPS